VSPVFMLRSSTFRSDGPVPPGQLSALHWHSLAWQCWSSARVYLIPEDQDLSSLLLKLSSPADSGALDTDAH